MIQINNLIDISDSINLIDFTISTDIKYLYKQNFVDSKL